VGVRLSAAVLWSFFAQEIETPRIVILRPRRQWHCSRLSATANLWISRGGAFLPAVEVFFRGIEFEKRATARAFRAVCPNQSPQECPAHEEFVGSAGTVPAEFLPKNLCIQCFFLKNVKSRSGNQKVPLPPGWLAVLFGPTLLAERNSMGQSTW